MDRAYSKNRKKRNALRIGEEIREEREHKKPHM
jgi:hypothetical protein